MQMVQLCATKCSCIAIFQVSLVSSVTITLCVTSQRVFVVVVVVVVYFVIDSIRKLLATPSIAIGSDTIASYSHPPQILIALHPQNHHNFTLLSLLCGCFPRRFTTKILCALPVPLKPPTFHIIRILSDLYI
jgi:hypothetical protein